MVFPGDAITIFTSPEKRIVSSHNWFGMVYARKVRGVRLQRQGWRLLVVRAP